jgi:hypothetical protein
VPGGGDDAKRAALERLEALFGKGRT